jgi:hypothetical protein
LALADLLAIMAAPSGEILYPEGGPETARIGQRRAKLGLPNIPPIRRIRSISLTPQPRVVQVRPPGHGETRNYNYQSLAAVDHG